MKIETKFSESLEKKCSLFKLWYREKPELKTSKFDPPPLYSWYNEVTTKPNTRTNHEWAYNHLYGLLTVGKLKDRFATARIYDIMHNHVICQFTSGKPVQMICKPEFSGDKTGNLFYDRYTTVNPITGREVTMLVDVRTLAAHVANNKIHRPELVKKWFSEKQTQKVEIKPTERRIPLSEFIASIPDKVESEFEKLLAKSTPAQLAEFVKRANAYQP